MNDNHNAGILQFGLDCSDIYYGNSSPILNVNTSIKSELACLLHKVAHLNKGSAFL